MRMVEGRTAEGVRGEDRGHLGGSVRSALDSWFQLRL